MPATLTDQKRNAIAEKLADIKAIQTLIIDNEQQFLNHAAMITCASGWKTCLKTITRI
jgi:hypothetical protein